MSKKSKLKKIHLVILGLLVFPILYSTIFGWKYRNIDTEHCGRRNLTFYKNYDKDLCQINGTNLILDRDGSLALLNIVFTSPEEIDVLNEKLQSFSESKGEPDLFSSMYTRKTWGSEYEETVYRIGQYDFDDDVEIIAASNPMLTSGEHGSEFLQISNYGEPNEEEAIWTQLFMAYVAQFSAWWSYAGLVLYVLMMSFWLGWAALRGLKS